MAATDGSVYQALRVQHIAGNPPNTDPQRDNETFDAYKLRMFVQGLNPDINATESDTEYLARITSYQPVAPYQFISASYALVAETELQPEISAAYADASAMTYKLNYSSSTHPIVNLGTGSAYLGPDGATLFVWNGLAWKSASLS